MLPHVSVSFKDGSLVKPSFGFQAFHVLKGALCVLMVHRIRYSKNVDFGEVSL